MNHTIAKIESAIKIITTKPNELKTAVVVPGSLNEDAATVTVQTPDGSLPLTDTLLLPITNPTGGWLLIPADDADVIMGTVDGGGCRVILAATPLAKAILKVGGNTSIIAGDSGITLQAGNTTLALTATHLKLSTASDSLHALLADLLQALTLLTVPTATGTSGTPINAATFTALATRLSALLEA